MHRPALAATLCAYHVPVLEVTLIQTVTRYKGTEGGCNAVSVSELVSRVLHPTRHIIDHFGDESFQAITCTGTDNSKQTTENTPKTQKVTIKQTN